MQTWHIATQVCIQQNQNMNSLSGQVHFSLRPLILKRYPWYQSQMLRL